MTDQIEWRTGKKVKPVFEFTEESWRQDALCAQVDVGDAFFPEGPGASSREAKAICRGCEVREPCLEYALHRPEWGIWGGKSVNERKAIRRERGIRLIIPITHGTEGGARAHYRKGEQPCEACLIAANAMARARKKAVRE